MDYIWDAFSSAIYHNVCLTEIYKFNYLRSLLRGTAYAAISELMLTASNYSQAIEVLRRLFGNKQLLIA